MDYTITTIKIPQPDGSYLIRPGKPQPLPDHISTTEAARLLGLSQRHIETLCTEGDFKTAFKPGGRPKSKWMISRVEVLQRLQP